MAEKNQVEILRQGVGAWNEWRVKNFAVLPNLQGISMEGAQLEEADFRKTNLKKASLQRANLRGANLSFADLQKANLDEANLAQANLRGANLRGAKLRGTKLWKADVRGADLQGAILWKADLPNANLEETDFRGAHLQGATLSDANLLHANLEGAQLTGIYIRNKDISIIPEHIRKEFGHTFYVHGVTDSLPEYSILRSIEFPPAYHQAGVSILNYFGTVLRQKYPGKKVKVRIEQEGLKVTMIVETEEGDRDTIERTLDEFGLVVLNQMQAIQLLPDPIHAMAFENKLEMANMEIRQAYKMLDMSEKRIEDLQTEVGSLRQIVGQVLHQSDKVLDISRESTRVIDGIAREALRRDQAFLKDMAARTENVRQELSTLADKLDTLRSAQEDIEEVKEILLSISQKEPGKYEKIKSYFSELATGTTASIYATVIFEALKLIS